MSNADFKRNFAKLLDAVGDKAELVVKKVAEDLINSVVLKSPVDTGAFRGNWNLSFGAADLSNSAPSNTDSVGKARAKLAGFTMGQHIFIVNNMPYAKRLEFDAWSSQAPQGMVRITVLEYGMYLRKQVQRLKNGG